MEAGDVLKCQPALGIDYPIPGNESFTLWYYAPNYSTDWEYHSNNDYYCLPYITQETGVSIQFIEVSSGAASEQYSLMIAAGDWPDMNPVNEYYTGGLTQAYEDDVIFDLLDYADDLPNFMYIFDQQSRDIQEQALNDGHLLSFVSISDGSYSGNGLVTRGDWMDEQGISYDGQQQITLDQFTDLLHTFRDAYGVECGYPCSDGTIGMGGAAFDTYAPTLISDGFMTFPGLTIFRYGDEVTSGWVADNYFDYVTWLYGLIEDGTLLKLTEVETDRMAQNSMQANGEISVWQANADKLDECADFVADKATSTFRAQAIPSVVPDESQVGADTIWKEPARMVAPGFSVSANSDKAGIVCQWMNWFWTDVGTLVYNYGLSEDIATQMGLSANRGEGQGPWFGSYRINEDGEVEWTDMITDTSAGGNAEKFSGMYTFSRFATSYQDNDRLLSTFTDNALNAVELWTIPGGDERYYPSAITLNTEDNERVNRLQNDILTYGEEQILRMLDGQIEITRENWDNYVNTINGMGLVEIVEIYQRYYDDYMAG